MALDLLLYYTDLEQMLKKNRQNIRQNGHWKLETSLKVGVQPAISLEELIMVIQKL